MKCCDFCKKQIEIAKKCPYCGNYIYTFAAEFIFGQTKNDFFPCEVNLTDKYLIVKKRSKGSFLGQTVAAAAGGIVGAAIAANAEKARSVDFGYYPISNIKYAIYPYRNNKLKNNLAVKIINSDDTDFILRFDLNGVFCESMTKRFVNGISDVGVNIQSGLNQNNGEVYCRNPFVDINTFGIYRFNESKKVDSSANNVYASATFNECNTNDLPPKFCFNCGTSLNKNDKFCSKCGQKI